MKWKMMVLLMILVMGIGTLCGCSSKNDNETVTASHKLKVTTSFYAMYDFAKKIGGDSVLVTNLVPSGIEPHDWEPTPNDIVNLERAQVFIYNGDGLETWTDKILQTLENKDLIVVEASKDLALIESSDPAELLQYDPHLWLNPLLAKKQMEAIKNTFVKADPNNKDIYEKNYTANAEEMDRLDAQYKAAVATFSKKDIIVAHQAFGYLCEAYGLNQVAIEGLSADFEPTPDKMVEIIEFAKANDVKTIFFETLVSPKVAETIAEEVGADTAVLNPIEGLNEEEMSQGADYFSIMRENLEALKKALQ
ncbi:MAG: zinc ABC transporter substrate-binding protein [Vallitaleaceae bacterium]|nr:zinc ABC transporter substrate-binding protein [Vallitaleaceae bacterium]